MQLQIVHLDDALAPQSAFLAQCAEKGAGLVEARVQGAAIRLWGREPDLRRLFEVLPARTEPTVAFFGSGDFHHVTALFLERTAAMAKAPFTVIHFDNHPDWVHFRGGMHCGSWVNRSILNPKVAKHIIVGLCSGDLSYPELKGGNLDPVRAGKLELYSFIPAASFVTGHYGEGASHRQQGHRLHWLSIAEIGLVAFAEHLLSSIDTEHVYITLDKDVLEPAAAITNWDQGRMRLGDVESLIRRISAAHGLIGADVTGDFSPVVLTGGRWTRLKKRGECLIDHARVRAGGDKITAINEATNLRLLAAFTEVMARDEAAAVA